MKVLVVTGGIGSGKSEVCRLFREFGIRGVYDADSRVKALYEAYPDLVVSIESALGLCLRNAAGNFVPGLLAERIFSDPDALSLVENLVFPKLSADFDLWKSAYIDDRFVVFESATILDKEYFTGFGDYRILVDAPLEMRIGRAVSRDGVTVEAVMKRIGCQKTVNLISENPGLASSYVDFVIPNDGNLHNLREKVRDVVEKIA